MNILLVGNGAREHVIAETLQKSRHNPQIFAFGKTKNPGIFSIAVEYGLGDVSDLDVLGQFITGKNIDFAFIGPENPLEAGVADFLAEHDIPCIGPTKLLAQLESSKSFTRNLLQKYNVPGNPAYGVFSDLDELRKFIVNEIPDQFVVKADQLCGGKGVKVQGDHFATAEEGIDFAQECIAAVGKVVIEEKLVGQEFSLMTFADGKSVAHLNTVQDHKRAFEGDKGPNTGGMGSYSYPDKLPFLSDNDLADAHEMSLRTMEVLQEEVGGEFKGIIFGGYMLTSTGVKIIEYNARFGDPEVMNLLPVLETDLVDICLAMIEGRLSEIEVKMAPKATVCKYVVPEGYPDNPTKGEIVTVDENYQTDAKLYYASIDQKDDGLYLGGSRSLAYVGIADDIFEAEQIAEDAVTNAVKGPVFHRKDIGTKELINQRMEMVSAWA